MGLDDESDDTIKVVQAPSTDVGIENSEKNKSKILESGNSQPPEEPPIENEIEAANAPRSLRKKRKFDYTNFYI